MNHLIGTTEAAAIVTGAARRTFVIASGAIAFILLFVFLQTQGVMAAHQPPAGGDGNPHIRPSPVGPPTHSEFELVGDVLAPRSGGDTGNGVRSAYPWLLPPDPRVLWPVTVRPFSTWDFGVIPVEFVAEASEAERARFWLDCEAWGAVAPVMCVPRTTQGHYLEVRKDALFNGQPSPCYSQVGGGGIGRVVMNLPGNNPGCFLNGALIHEQGHAFGLAHEHQRADRDDYILVNFDLTTDSTRGSYEKYDTSVSWVPPLFGPYDFLSVMHYGCGTIGGNFIITPLPQFSEYQQKCGAGTFVDGRTRPTPLDHEVLALFYRNRLVWGGEHRPRYAPTQRFDREDFLTAMERLHAFYMSREGLHRQEGLSIGGRPDFLGIATWIFDVYLGARSAGWHHWSAFDIVVASVTQTDEWRTKNPGLTPIRPDPFSPSIRFDRAEFLDVLQRLDAYYASPEGLQRPNGLSIANGPDFLGIATWVFDVYLNERLRGTRPETAWSIVVRAIENTDEWKQKHRR